jgi:hypothetical protein
MELSATIMLIASLCNVNINTLANETCVVKMSACLSDGGKVAEYRNLNKCLYITKTAIYRQ